MELSNPTEPVRRFVCWLPPRPWAAPCLHQDGRRSTHHAHGPDPSYVPEISLAGHDAPMITNNRFRAGRLAGPVAAVCSTWKMSGLDARRSNSEIRCWFVSTAVNSVPSRPLPIGGRTKSAVCRDRPAGIRLRRERQHACYKMALLSELTVVHRQRKLCDSGCGSPVAGDARRPARRSWMSRPLQHQTVQPLKVLAPRERAFGSTSSQRRTKRLFAGVCRPRSIVLTAGFALNRSTLTATGSPLTEIVATPKS